MHREKQIALSHPLTVPVRTYQKWLDLNLGEHIEWFFPRTNYSPFTGNFTFTNKPLSTRQLLRIVQRYNPNVWCHLFRETVGADIVRGDPSIMAVWKVKKRLDLEKTATAWRYMDRWGSDIIERNGEE